MTNEEAKRNLVYAKRWGDKPDDEALEMAIKALEQTRWIPCSERLPEEGQKVLVTDTFESVTTAIYFKKSSFWREMVIAWRTFEPYKAESEE